jgi:hypothetical protein
MFGMITKFKKLETQVNESDKEDKAFLINSLPSLIAPTRVLSTLRRAVTCLPLDNMGVKTGRWGTSLLSLLATAGYFLAPEAPYKIEVAKFLAVTNVLDLGYNMLLFYRNAARYEPENVDEVIN